MTKPHSVQYNGQVEKQFLDGRIIICAGDITKIPSSVIVNAANSSLIGGGGVDGAIHKAGGPVILEECRHIRATDYPQGMPVSEVAVTSAGKLQAKYIFHTVGPIWSGGQRDEDVNLEKAYVNCLQKAIDLECKDISFPAISTGIYGFPRERAATLVKKLLLTWTLGHPSPAVIRLVFFNLHDAEIFEHSPGDF